MKSRALLYLPLFLLFACADDTGVTPPTDNPITLAAQNSPNTWVYIGDDEMFSRDGSTTGYLASISPNSTKLLVYFEGGGACYNALTCNSNNGHFDSTNGQTYINGANGTPPPTFNRTTANNPYKDWSYIFIPYSTGDVHSGSNGDADVPNGGPQDQNMNGFSNFGEVVKELFGHYGSTGIDEFIVTGSSAGGYGTYLNFIQVADTFPNAKMTGLIDAGPMFLDANVFDDCLANVWDNLFQFSYPRDYDSIVTGTYNQRVQGIYEYLSKKYPNANFGLMTDNADETIRWFFGFGLNGCNGTAASITDTAFKAGLADLQAHLATLPNWHVFYEDDNKHTFLGGRYLTVTVNGVLLADWIEDVRAGNAVDVTP